MKTFLNLTNGLLYLEEDKPFDGFIRIQSCHCEDKQWERILYELDSNFIMWLALGHKIQIVDYSAKKEVPRALYQGLEWVWFVCRKAWNIPIDKVWVRNCNVTRYFEEQYRNLPNYLRKRKFQYFKKYLNNPKKPTIISGQTDKDGDYEYFSQLVEKIQPKIEEDIYGNWWDTFQQMVYDD